VLAPLEHKSLQSDRVILIPGPQEEVNVVASIYRRFIHSGKNESEIAAELNMGEIRRDCNRPWTREVVQQILTNPKYIGDNVSNRRSCKLKQKEIKNPPHMWVQRERAFAPIVSRVELESARRIIQDRKQGRKRVWTDKEMLDRLLDFLKDSGTLSGRLIDEAKSLPSARTYILRFGGLARVYALIGWQGARDLSFVETRKALKGSRCEFTQIILDSLVGCGATISRRDSHGLLTINDEFTASIRVAFCVPKPRGPQWRVGFERIEHPDVSLIARLDVGNQSIRDYFVLPAPSVTTRQLSLGETNPLHLEVYRFDCLDSFLSLCRRSPVGGAV